MQIYIYIYTYLYTYICVHIYLYGSENQIFTWYMVNCPGYAHVMEVIFITIKILNNNYDIFFAVRLFLNVYRILFTFDKGNNWGFCRNGDDKVGCGKQEVFRGCADVAIFGQDDHTYYKYLNLTTEADLTSIINIVDDTHDHDKHGHHHDHNDDHFVNDNTVVAPSGDVPVRYDPLGDNDDLDKLDADGDGLIEINGNFLSLKDLKEYILSSGLLDFDKQIKIKNLKKPQNSGNMHNYDGIATTTRTRSKYRSVRNQNRGETTKQIKERGPFRYVTRAPNGNALPHRVDFEESGDKNNGYVPSDTFRRSSFFASFNTPMLTTRAPEPLQFSPSITDFTLGPVVIHKSQRPQDQPARSSILQKDHSKLTPQDSSTGRPNSVMSVSTDTLPQLFRHVSAVNKIKPSENLLNNNVIHISPTSTDHDLLLNVVKKIFSSTTSTTTPPPTQIPRVAFRTTKVSIPNIIISPKSAPTKASISIGQAAQQFKGFPEHIFHPIIDTLKTKSPAITMTTQATRRRSSSTQRTRTRPQHQRTSTPSVLSNLRSSIRNLAAQTQIFSNNQKVSRQELKNTKPRLQTASSGNSISAIPSTKFDISPTSPNMAGAVAFQVRIITYNFILLILDE